MRKLTNQELRASAENRVANHTKPKHQIYLVLDNLRSVYNIGAIFRTADATGVTQIILCGICATPPRDDLHKTALGTEEYVSWQHCKTTVDAIKRLKDRGIKIVALELTDQSQKLNDFKYLEPTALIVGNETEGINQEALNLCDLALEIPMLGSANSLNVATATGIALFKMFNS